MKTIIAKKIRDYGPNFALYKIDAKEAVEVNTLEGLGSRKVKLPSNFNGVIAVREIDFRGWAKGRTGRHKLNDPNTDTIVISLLRVGEDHKVSAGAWQLLNQNEINDIYRKEVAYNF